MQTRIKKMTKCFYYIFKRSILAKRVENIVQTPK